MLPVSGAEQLKTSGANAGERPMISQSGAYSDVGQAGAVLALGQKQVPQPRGARLRLELFDDRRRLPAIALGDLALKRRLVRIDVLVHERGEPLRERRATCRRRRGDMERMIV